MKCLSSWPDHCEMLVASMKAATRVAVLALYSKYFKTVPKHVCVRIGLPLSEAVIGVEKSHLIFLQAMVSTCNLVQLFSLVVSVWLVVCSACPKLCLHAS